VNQTIGDPISLGDTYFIVIKGISSAAGNDEFFALNYGPADSVPIAEPANANWHISVSEAVNHIYNAIRLQLGTNASGEFDEIRVGTTWESVTVIPEPASLGLLVIAGLGLPVWRRRRSTGEVEAD
jgi:hypothetical protein